MWILDVAIRPSIVVLAALAIAALLRHRSAAVRHWVLAIGILGSICVVPLARVLPSWDLPTLRLPQPSTPSSVSFGTPEDASSIAPVSAPTPEPLDLTRTAAVVWSAGIAVSLTLMLASGVRLWRLRRRAVPVAHGAWPGVCREIAARYGLARPVALLETDASHALGTWGLRRPQVLLPRQAGAWTAERAHIVLGHELAHVKRGDWLVQVLAEIVRAVFWFNPIYWIACAELRRESEHACDDIVLGNGVAAADYAAHLVDIARVCRPPLHGYSPAMSMARPSTLERRVTAMLNRHLDRRHASSRSRILIAALVLACVVVPSAVLRTAAQGATTLSGTIFDPTGAVLPQVDVTLETPQGLKRRVATDSAGQFAFDQIAPGRYALETNLLGFRPARQEFDLNQASDYTRSITLQVGTIQETISVKAPRPSGTTAASGAGRPVGGNIKVPRKIVDVKPIYPETMRDSGLEAEVQLEAIIGVDGTVISARVASAQVHPDFASAAIDAVRQWRFTPTLLNGTPIEVSMRVSVNFSLSD